MGANSTTIEADLAKFSVINCRLFKNFDSNWKYDIFIIITLYHINRETSKKNSAHIKKQHPSKLTLIVLIWYFMYSLSHAQAIYVSHSIEFWARSISIRFKNIFQAYQQRLNGTKTSIHFKIVKWTKLTKWLRASFSTLIVSNLSLIITYARHCFYVAYISTVSCYLGLHNNII